MKNQLIEKDGLLFMKCEPEPLDYRSEKPCIIQYIKDDTPMGRYNHSTTILARLNEAYLYKGEFFTIEGEPLSRFEVIATHCPEGSSAWALWQMLNGKMVSGTRAYKICHNNIYSLPEGSETWGKDHVRIDRWIDSLPKDGWKIYYREEHYTDVFEVETEPASLKPDFSDVEVGDMVFSLANGYTEIEDVDERIDPYPIKVNDEWHMSDGRISEYDLYPIVFNDHHQAKAYFGEIFRKMTPRGDKPCNQ